MDILDDRRLRYLRENLMDRDTTIATPFGEKRRVYFDYISCGLPFAPIEELLTKKVLPHMANTHSESNFSGRQMTYFLDRAYQSVADSIGATDDDVIIFTGAGSTSAINKLILAMGLRIPEQISVACGCGEKLPLECRPIIFRSMMEHHSNDIAWRETVGHTMFVGFDKAGRIDWRDLERRLKLPEVRERVQKIGTFSAASNVTGILNDVDALCEVMHEYGGVAFFDYAAAAPYVSIDMHPEPGEGKRRDALFISTHKFTGGPQTPGILAASRKLFTSSVPVEPGGGTVLYTSPWDHQYLGDLRSRETGGTPPIVQIIRAGLVFELKRYLGEELLDSAEHELVKYATKRLLANKAITLLGNPEVDRLGVFSSNFHNGELHYNLAVRLLNDRFGIQVRAGCMCAGTYGHELLGIDQEDSEEIRRALDDGETWSKPGWVRISLSPATSREDLDFLLDALDIIGRDWKDYADRYKQDQMGEFLWAGKDFKERFTPLNMPFPEHD